MKRHASPAPESGGQWTLATVLSVGLHAGAFVWMLDLIPDFSRNAAPPDFPETVITIAPAVAQIDNDGVASTGEPTGAEAADPDLAETVAPDDSLSAEEAEAAETAGAESLPPAGAETVQPAEVARAEPAAPAQTAEEADTQTTAEVTPPDAAQAAAPQVLAPITPDGASGAIAPLASLGALDPSDTLTPAPTAPQAAPSGNLSTLTPEGTLTSVLPQAPTVRSAPRPAAPSAPAQDPALTALIARIRANLDDACLVALPRPQAAPLGPLVTTLTDQDITASRFEDSVLRAGEGDLTLDTRRLLVDARQCPALTFLRAQTNYPAFQLRMGLAQTQIPSGGTLVGRVEGAAGAYTSLLLVDDNGVVQDLRRFLRFTGGRAEFAIPVTRDGPARETAALLIALATPERPRSITTLAGRLAADLFPPLAEELGPGTRIAVQALDIR